jgi:hypothetical protein
MRWRALVAIGALAFGIAGVIALIPRNDMSAIQHPGLAEKYICIKVPRAAIRRRATELASELRSFSEDICRKPRLPTAVKHYEFSRRTR